MRLLIHRPRSARAAIALLAGLIVGGWVGGGLVWVLNRSKFKEPGTVAEISLMRAEEVEMVPADAMGFVHARLADLWKTEAMAEFRKVLEKAGPDALKALDEGFLPPPSTVDRATVVFVKPKPAANPAPIGPTPIPKKGPTKGGAGAPPLPPPPPFSDQAPGVFAILAFSAPFDADKVQAAIFPKAVPDTAGEKKYWRDGGGLALHFPSDRLMIVGEAAAVSEYLSKEPAKEGVLAPAIKLAASGNRHLVAAVDVQQLPARFPIGLPSEIGPVLRADSVALGLVIGDGAKFDLRAIYRDDAKADEAEKSLRDAAEKGRKKLAETKTDMEAKLKPKGNDKMARSIQQLPEAIGSLFMLGAVNMLDEWLADPPLKRDGREIALTGSFGSLGSAYAGTIGLSMGLLVPAVEKVREAAARTSDSNNLKQIALGIINYADSHLGMLPSPIGVSKATNSKPLLSWHVAMLPYIEQQNLYQKFKLDEPWDSEHNKKLIPLMPKIYMTPLSPTDPGKTYYKVFVGGGAIFDRTQIRKYPASIPDGTSNTILVAEGGDPVIWTKPEDFEFDPKKPLPNIWLPGLPGINVAMADGSVRYVRRTVSEPTLRHAIQADDGMVLGDDW